MYNQGFEITQSAISQKIALNDKQSIFLVELSSKKNQKKVFILKSYQKQKRQQEMLKKLLVATHNAVIKPIACRLQSQRIYIASQIQKMSLESLLYLHKKNRQPIRRELVKSFSHLFQTLNKIQKTSHFHGNLKPSNIFVDFPKQYLQRNHSQQSFYNQKQINAEDIKWRIAQTGLNTGCENKYYSKGLINANNSNASFFFDQYKNDFFSLGVMLLQMTTLQPIQIIHEEIVSGDLDSKYFAKLSKMQISEEHYQDDSLSNFIRGLLYPQQIVKLSKATNGSLHSLYHEYQKCFQLRPFQSSVQYRDFLLSGDVLKGCFVTQEVVGQLLADIKRNLAKDEKTCDQILEFLRVKMDPQEQFYFPSPQGLDLFLHEYVHCSFKEKVHGLIFATYFSYESHISYMSILVKTLDVKQIATRIIKNCIQKFDSATQFFKQQTQSKEVWKIQDLHKFFHMLRVTFTPNDMRQVLKLWTLNDKATSIKLDQFKKIFHQTKQPVKSEKLIGSGDQFQSKIKMVCQMLQELQKTQKNLVHFFRIMPGQHKWEVPLQKLKDQLKKYYKFKDAVTQKQILNELLRLGRLSENKSTIDYIKLLVEVKYYEPIDLFRKVLVQRINEDGIQPIFNRHSKDSRGWTRESVSDFCSTQYLQFNQTYQHAFFQILDKDNSNYVSLKELMFKLTGIKEFDLDFVIQRVKQQTRNDGQRVFDVFVGMDRHISLILQRVDELKLFFDEVNVKIEPSHCQELYNKFATRNGHFQYLLFLRYFCDLHLIFMKTSKLIIQNVYKGDFDIFFQKGLSAQQKKWKRQSLTRINQKMTLGFRQTELDQLWKVFDKNQQFSLTKEQIGQLFDKKVQKYEQFKGKTVQSLHDYIPKKSQQAFYNRQSPPNQKRRNDQKTQQKKLEKNQLIIQMKTMKIIPFLTSCLRKSQKSRSVHIQIEQFCHILKDQGINCNKKFLQASFSHCLNKRSGNDVLFNYLKFFLLLSQFKMDQQKQKAQCLRYMLASFCKSKKLKAQDIFEGNRVRDKMKLSKFETVIKEILEDQLYFEDISEAWSFWGNPDFITQRDLDKILQQQDPGALRNIFQRNVNRKGGQQQQNQPIKPFIRSRQNSTNQRGKNQNIDTYQSRDNRGKNQNIDTYQSRDNRRVEKDRSPTGNFNYQYKDQRQYGKQVEDEQKNQYKTTLERRTSVEENLYLRKQRNDPRPNQKSKRSLIQRFQTKLQQKSTNSLVKLFEQTSKVQKQAFSNCLDKYYDFSRVEADQLAEQLSDFGVVRIQTIKKYMRTSPNKKQRYQSPQDQRNKKQKKRSVEFSKKTPQNLESDRLVKPFTGQQRAQRKLANPYKQKLNSPLIKQQIRMLIRSFSQKHAIQQIQRYFFDGRNTSDRDGFIKRCRQINSSLNEASLERIFEYLKPNQKDQINILSFKVSFSTEQGVQAQEQYLPKQLVRQLSQIFNSHDKDKSGFIDPAQVQTLLGTLGFNQTQKQIQNVFQKIDKNFDNKISFDQFKLFIEEFILPHLVEFEDEVDQLFTMMRMNDVFNTGAISPSILVAVLQRFGVKLTNQEAAYLTRYIGNQDEQVPIYDFIYALYFPNNQSFPPIVKCALYKVKLRKKLSLKEIQKTFTNISSCFVMAYTSRIMKSEYLKRSAAFQPIIHQSYMFYQDFFYKDFRKIQPSKNGRVLVDEDNRTNTIIVQIRVPDICGVPIPQNASIKGKIMKRSLNITFFDISAQCAKYSITSLQADWDADIQDEWSFDMKNRAVFMKISNYDAKKYEKILVLFELIITINQNGRTLDVSCGSASISVKELVSVQKKLEKKVKLISGIPSKSKQIDKLSVTKRTGWKNFLTSSQIESKITIQIFSQKYIDPQTILSMFYGLPSICLVKRKALHYIWTFREYFAERCIDKDMINPQFASNHTVQAFLLSLDVDDVSSLIANLWKQKVEKNVPQVWQARAVMYAFLTDLYMILSSKQFQLKLSNPCASVITNKSLYMLRQKMVTQIFDNIGNYAKNDLPQGKTYKRLKNYNYNYSPVMMEYRKGSLQSYINQNAIRAGKN